MASESALSPAPRRRGRPPRAAPAYGTSREALIRAGVAALSEKGYSATGLEEILRSAGVPKGSFYHYFPGKDAFGAVLIDSYARYFARKLDRWLRDAGTAPLQRLRNFVADARAGMARFGFRRGCVVGNLGQEMSALPEAFREQLHGVLLDWQARTERCLREAQAAGEIAAEADCAALAAFFWIGWEGAVLRAKLERSPAPLDLFANQFLACLAR
ncbi:acrylate utilization transcriptional regulator AcuR [Methylobacterium symbioticum]|uniref:Transcriptional regulator AcuR n=1 Tax=Methylobacterium symbioticum TaxID=2584084 RepID=A0A509EF37_9HYPH|nr:TetR/AcrR family transcriptional regulator [Methylobacterium symbioticum]VUD72758.1 Transcriptional regulator AcuR [Methylobacterium symbioticum]